MQEESGDTYERLLVEWQARRTLVDAYHRSLRFLVAHNGDAPKQQDDLVEKLGDALTALRATNDQMCAYEQEHGAPNSQ